MVLDDCISSLSQAFQYEREGISRCPSKNISCTWVFKNFVNFAFINNYSLNLMEFNFRVFDWKFIKSQFFAFRDIYRKLPYYAEMVIKGILKCKNRGIFSRNGYILWSKKRFFEKKTNPESWELILKIFRARDYAWTRISFGMRIFSKENQPICYTFFAYFLPCWQCY